MDNSRQERWTIFWVVFGQDEAQSQQSIKLPAMPPRQDDEDAVYERRKLHQAQQVGCQDTTNRQGPLKPNRTSWQAIVFSMLFDAFSYGLQLLALFFSFAKLTLQAGLRASERAKDVHRQLVSSLKQEAEGMQLGGTFSLAKKRPPFFAICFLSIK